MFKESRLIHVTPTLSATPRTAVDEPTSAPNIAHAIETSRAIKDSDKRLESLRATIEQGQTTEERMQAVETLVAQDQSQESVLLANQMIDAEIARTSTEKNQLTAQVQLTSQQELTELQARIERASQARHAVLQAENIRLQSKEVQPITTKIGDVFENATESAFAIVNPELNNKMSRRTKIAISAVATIGGLLLLKKLFNKLTNKKPKESNETDEDATKKPWYKKLFNKWVLLSGAAVIGTGAFLHLKGYMDLKNLYKKGKEKAEDLYENGKNKTEDLYNQGREALRPDKPWEKYGLNQLDYKEAKDLYAENTPKSNQTIKVIFGINETETSTEYEMFIADMKEIFDPIEKNGIKYSSYERTKKSTEKTLGIFLRDLEQLVEQNIPGLVAIGLLSANVTFLRNALATTGSIFAKFAAVNIALARFTARSGTRFTKNHPFFAVAAIGGAAGTTFGALQQIEGAKGPEDFNELLKAGMEDKPFFIDGTTGKPLQNVTVNSLESVRGSIKTLAKYSGDLASLVANESADFVSALYAEIQESLTTTPEKEIYAQNTAGFEQMHDILQDMEDQESSQANADQGALTQISVAKEALSNYETSFFATRNQEDFSSNEESIEALTKFTQACRAIGLTIEVENNIVKVTNATGEKTDLSIDPTINDVNSAFEASNQLSLSSEWILSKLISAAWQQTRLDQGEFREGGIETLGASGTFGMVVGNTIYALNPLNWSEYIVYQFQSPIELAKALYGTDNKWEETAGKAVASSVALSISSTVLNRLTPYVGYVNTIKPNIAQRIMRHVPGINLGLTAKNLYQTQDRLREIAKVEANLGLLLRENAILSAAKVNPKWFKVIETGSAEDLRKVLKAMRLDGKENLRALTMGPAEIKGVRMKLKEKCISRIDSVKKSHLSIFTDKDLIDGERIYNKIAGNYKAKFTGVIEGATDTEAKLARATASVDGAPNVANTATDTARSTARSIDALDPADELYDVLRHSSDPDLLRAKLNPEMLTALAKMTEEELVITIPKLTEHLRTSNVTIDSIDQIKLLNPYQSATVIDDATETLKKSDAVTALLDHKHIERLAKQSGKTPQEIADFLTAHLDDVDAKTIENITSSRSARKLLMGAMNSTDPATEVPRILQAAKKASHIRLGVKGAVASAGVAGDVFGLYMAYQDWEANKDRMAATTNPQLKELYANANIIYAAEGTESIAGLAIGGYAFVTGGVAGLASASAVVLLPIAAAVALTRYTYKKLEDSAEYHTLNEKDLQLKPPGEILNHIGKSKDGEYLSYVQQLAEAVPFDGWSKWDSSLDVNMRSANWGSRNEGYRAYYSQLALTTVPDITVLDLEPDDLEYADTPEAMQLLLKNRTADVRSRFVFDSLRYIAFKTKNTFEQISPDLLENAQLFAEHEYEMRINDPEYSTYMDWKDEDSWQKKEAETIINRKNKRHESIANELNTYIEEPIFDTMMPTYVLKSLQHELATYDAKLTNENTEYSNWSSSAAWSFRQGWSGEADMAISARGITMIQIRNTMNKEIERAKSNKSITPEYIQALKENIKAILVKNPDQQALTAMNSDTPELYYTAGTDPKGLTVESLVHFL